jgi:hypothetical protein
MSFDKEQYRKSKKYVISLIKASHDWQNMEGFIADGIINPDIYQNQKLKVLVMLGESYGYSQNEMVDIEKQSEDDILGVGHHNRQTTKKVSALLWLLYQSLETDRELTDDDFPYLMENVEENIAELQAALSRAAWVNVKKASKHIEEFGNGATRQNGMEVYQSALKNKTVLKEQIESISPDLMIVCSIPVFDSLYDLKLLGDGIKRGKKYQVQTNDKNQKIIQVDHPSYYKKWGYNGILDIYKTIYLNVIKKN